MNYDISKLNDKMNSIDKLNKSIHPINNIKGDTDEEFINDFSTVINVPNVPNVPNVKNNPLQGTYLESKESIIELYKLFIFYGLMESYFSNHL